jgi:hypothetical protein
MWGHPTKPSGQVNLSADLARQFADKKKKYYSVQDPKEREQLLDELRGDREQLIQQALRFSRPAKARTNKHILWQIDFSEIFQGEKPGFDIMIANPPYLRHELIDSSIGEFSLMARVEFIREVYSELCKTIIDGKSDLYIYFFFRGLMLLKQKGGVCCFICSNSWLDVKYGSSLQSLTLRDTSTRYIIDNSLARSFSNAAINTTIDILVTDLSSETDKLANFCSFRKPFSDWNFSVGLKGGNQKVSYRILSVPHSRLRNEGLDEKGRFTGGKWGAFYLRAPDILFDVLELLNKDLVLVRDVAVVRFGVKTGANEFFLMDQEAISRWGIEEKFLIPILKSPKEVSTIFVKPLDLPLRLFVCNYDKNQLRGTNALEYINWGESQKYNLRPSTKNRGMWWSIGDRQPSLVNCNYQIHHVMRFFTGAKPFFVSNNFHELHPKGDKHFSICASLNSSISQLWVNATGRANFGDGLLKIEGYEAETIPLLNPNLFDEYEAQSVILRCKDLGVNGSDRELLDDYVLSKTTVSISMRSEIKSAIQSLVQQRLSKAGSL